MIAKDKFYWKEYNAKRKAYLQQKNKERYHQDKGCINTTNSDTTILTTNNTTTDTTEAVVLKTDTTENNTTLQPQQELIQPCSNCLQLKEQLENQDESFNAYLHNYKIEINKCHQQEISKLKEKYKKNLTKKQI